MVDDHEGRMRRLFLRTDLDKLEASPIFKALRDDGACLSAALWVAGTGSEEVAWRTCTCPDWLAWVIVRRAGRPGYWSLEHAVGQLAKCLARQLPASTSREAVAALSTAAGWRGGADEAALLRDVSEGHTRLSSDDGVDPHVRNVLRQLSRIVGVPVDHESEGYPEFRADAMANAFNDCVRASAAEWIRDGVTDNAKNYLRTICDDIRSGFAPKFGEVADAVQGAS